jgi:hypothetical protein
MKKIRKRQLENWGKGWGRYIVTSKEKVGNLKASGLIGCVHFWSWEFTGFPTKPRRLRFFANSSFLYGVGYYWLHGAKSLRREEFIGYWNSQHFIAFTRARHWSLPWARWIQSIQPHSIPSRSISHLSPRLNCSVDCIELEEFCVLGPWVYCLACSSTLWRWLQYVPPKRRLNFDRLHGVISQKILLFMW